MKYKDGEPCNHSGCLQHRTHPCEGCGRVGGHPIEEYQKYAFCKAVDCQGLCDDGACYEKAPQLCLMSAKEFHHWLKDNGYKIAREIK